MVTTVYLDLTNDGRVNPVQVPTMAAMTAALASLPTDVHACLRAALDDEPTNLGKFLRGRFRQAINPPDANPVDAWLDRHIAEQAAYWTARGLPGDIVAQVAEEIELYGDDALEAGITLPGENA